MVVIIDNLDLRWTQGSLRQWVFLSQYPNNENGAKSFSNGEMTCLCQARRKTEYKSRFCICLQSPWSFTTFLCLVLGDTTQSIRLRGKKAKNYSLEWGTWLFFFLSLTFSYQIFLIILYYEIFQHWRKVKETNTHVPTTRT